MKSANWLVQPKANEVGTDYKGMISNLAQSLMPGGDVEKSYIADAEQEGKQLAAQLNAASIAKGLGNATSSAPVTAMKHVAKRKTEIRSGLLQQLLPLLQNLMSMEQQQKQFEASQAQQYVMNRPVSNASRGLDAFGRPMGAKWNAPATGGTQTPGFSATSYPSLATAGGMQTGSPAMEAPSLFGGAPVGGGETWELSDLLKKVTFSEAEADKRDLYGNRA